MDPSDEKLAKLYRWTLHTKWSFEGAPGGSGIGAHKDPLKSPPVKTFLKTYAIQPIKK